MILVVGALAAMPQAAPARATRATSPRGKVMIVNANLHESHPRWPDDIRGSIVSDLEYAGDLRNFVLHLKAHIAYPPDILLLQEVLGSSARTTARLLTLAFEDSYRVAIAGGDANVLSGEGTSFEHKQNTAILFNQRTMRLLGRPGYVTVAQTKVDHPLDQPGIAQDQAYALLEERQSGFNVAAMSIHWPTTWKFTSKSVAAAERTHWSRKLATFMQTTYSRARIRVMAGEFNSSRCRGWRERLGCAEAPFWTTLARPPYRLRDAVYVRHRRASELRRQATSRNGNPLRIDFIFAKPIVFRATRSVGYEAPRYTPRYFSDHKYDRALVGVWSPGPAQIARRRS